LEFFDFAEQGVDEEACGLAGPSWRVVGAAVQRGCALWASAVEGFELDGGEEFGEFGDLSVGAFSAAVALGGLSPGGGDVVRGAGFGEEGLGSAPGVVAGAGAGLLGGVVVHGWLLGGGTGKQ
jgi:hypothetical protein